MEFPFAPCVSRNEGVTTLPFSAPRRLTPPVDGHSLRGRAYTDGTAGATRFASRGRAVSWVPWRSAAVESVAGEKSSIRSVELGWSEGRDETDCAAPARCVPGGLGVATAEGYKVCPACRVEHVQRATRCADCDVELVQPSEMLPEQDPVELPPASELACIRVAPLAWVRALSDGLEQRGLPHRIEPGRLEDAPEGQRPEVFGEAELFGVYVGAQDEPAAKELDSQIAQQVLPEEAPTLAAGEAAECPACGSALETASVECPDCGLVLG